MIQKFLFCFLLITLSANIPFLLRWLLDFISISIHINPLSANPHKMVKNTQTIFQLLTTNCLSVFDYFVELALKALMSLLLVSLFSCVVDLAHVLWQNREKSHVFAKAYVTMSGKL